MRSTSLLLPLALAATFIACVLAQEFPRFKITSSTVNTELTCQSCVADGFGQFVIQEQCDNGEFDNLCDAGDCSCPFTIRRALITCEGGACFVAKTLQVDNVKFEKVSEAIHELRYQVEAEVFDKENLAPGGCDSSLVGKTSVKIPAHSVTSQVVKKVENAVRQAIAGLAFSAEDVCDEIIRKVANRALQKALPKMLSNPPF